MDKVQLRVRKLLTFRNTCAVRQCGVSLRAAALGFWRRSNLRISGGIASGEEQESPRKDMDGGSAKEIIFLRILSLRRQLPLISGRRRAPHREEIQPSFQWTGNPVPALA